VRGEQSHAKAIAAVSSAWSVVPNTVIQDDSPTWGWATPNTSRVNNRPQTLYLLVCPSAIISTDDLQEVLLKYPPFSSDAESWAFPLEVKEVTVPRLAPTSPEQANAWSEAYWPTFYRKTNPFGAHPATISKAELELQEPKADNISVDDALLLAEQAASEMERTGLGVGTGVVIVERGEDKTEILAVAGDARRNALPSENAEDTCCQGNVMAHAIMRAVGMVARKRLRVASQSVAKDAAKAEGNFAAVGLTHDVAARDAFFVDLPVNDLEREYFDKDNIKADGYLCLKLEVFTTHEPCIMCSMALVHSRVGKVIFKHRMPQTGGLTAEKVRNDSGPEGLGYGMCWRKELNWQFMCWEYRPTTDEEDAALEAAQARSAPAIESWANNKQNKGETQDQPDKATALPGQLDGAQEHEREATPKPADRHHGETQLASEHQADTGTLSFASICV